MSDQKHQNKEQQLPENTAQIVDNKNLPSESSVNEPEPKLKEPELRPELRELESGSELWPELKELESGSELWSELKEPASTLEPKPELKEPSPELKELESSLEPRQELKEQELTLKPELKEPSLEPKPELKELRPELKEPESSREPKPELKEVELKPELQEPSLEPRPELKEAEPKPELKEPIPEQRPELKETDLSPQLWPELKEVELKPELNKLSLEPRPGPKEPESSPVLWPEAKEPRQELKDAELRQEQKEQSLKLKQELRPDPTKPWTPGAVFVAFVAIGVAVFALQLHGTNLDSKSAPQIFQDEFKSLQNDFPGQIRDLWSRSGKMLTNHLNKSHPGEPATLILTAAQDAKHTLLCLGSGLAHTYAFAHNSSWLVIHGPSEAKYDGSTAKLHIDEKLSKGFESTHRAAVLNRLETLPSGALLILYKYCDHENAAYKDVALVFTVLLEDSTLDPETPLPDLEEKVRDFLWQQFIISGTVRSHQEMDSDKLSGVWSRISHLVLPVLPVKSIEFGNCPFDHK